MNSITVLIGVVLVVVTAAFVYVAVTVPEAPPEIVYSDEQFVFTDTTGESFSIQYDATAQAALVLYADNQYELTKIESDSGIQYQSGNELVVFTEQGGEATLKIDDQILVTGVVEDLVSTTTVATDQDSPGGEMSEQTESVSATEPTKTAAVVEVATVPVLGQRCIDGPAVDCAALKAAARGEVD